MEQIAFVRKIPDSNRCIKVCVRFNQKSRLKSNKYNINRVTTVGKVIYKQIANSKDYKKIE